MAKTKQNKNASWKMQCLFLVLLVNAADYTTTFQKVYIGYVCHGGDIDGVTDGRKRWAASYKPNHRFFLFLAFRHESKTEESPLLLLLHTNVLHSLIITPLRSLLRCFLLNHSNDILIPQIHCISVYVLYVYLHFIQQKE